MHVFKSMLQCQAHKDLYNLNSALLGVHIHQQTHEFYEGDNTHKIIDEHNPRIEEYIISSSIHKHTDPLENVFVPLAVIQASILETSW